MALGTVIAYGALFDRASPATAAAPKAITDSAGLVTALSRGGDYMLPGDLNLSGAPQDFATATHTPITIDLDGHTLTIRGTRGGRWALVVNSGDTLTLTHGRLGVTGGDGSPATGPFGSDGDSGEIAVEVRDGAKLNVDQAAFIGGNGAPAANSIGIDAVGVGGVGGIALSITGVVTSNSLKLVGGNGERGGKDLDGASHGAGGAGGAGGAAINGPSPSGVAALVSTGLEPVTPDSSGGNGGRGSDSAPNGIGGNGGDGADGADAHGMPLTTMGIRPGSGGAGGASLSAKPDGLPGADGAATAPARPTFAVNVNIGAAPTVYRIYAITEPVGGYVVSSIDSLLPSVPTEAGFILTGWAASDDATKPLSASEPVLEGSTLYGVWVPKAPAWPATRPTAAPFPDVPATAPFFRHIDWLFQQKITTGYADGTFRPGATLTRAAAAAFLYRQAHHGGDAAAPAVAPFDDVPVTNRFAGEIAWAKTHGITAGYADGTFRPGEALTRAADAAFLYRQANPGRQAAAPSAVPFADVGPGTRFAGEIAWAKAHQVAHGYADGTFRPGQGISRAAGAAFLARAGR